MGTPFSVAKVICVSGTALFELFPTAATAGIIPRRHLGLSYGTTLIQDSGKLGYGFDSTFAGIDGNVRMQLRFCHQRLNLLLARLAGYNQLQRKLLASAFLTGVGFEAAIGRVMLPCKIGRASCRERV